MGAALSLIAPSAPTVAISSYIDNLEDYEYVELINNPRFLKTIKTLDNNTGYLLITKVLIKPSTLNYVQNVEKLTDLLTKEATLLSQSPNVLPWHRIIDTDRAGYLIRQYIRTNLYDRLSLMPFLEPIEKAFLTFQAAKIVFDIHERYNIHHGDLKLENFMVTSGNWLLLTDFSEYIKPTFLPEDNPNQFSFYFDSSDRRICYIAPERFYNSKNEPTLANDEYYANEDSKLTNEMDLFSLGCVIAELYLEGEPIFSLSQLFKYIKDEYEPDLSGIESKDIQRLVRSLIHINPKERPSMGLILKEFRGKCFPEFFYEFLYDYVAGLNDANQALPFAKDDNYTLSDCKISYIYDSFDRIVTGLQLDYKSVVEQTGDDYSENLNSEFIPITLNLKGLPKDYRIRSRSKLGPDSLKDASLVILSVIFSLIRSLKRPESKIKACEIIIALSERISDECKLDRSLPYLCYFIDEYVEEANNRHSMNSLSFANSEEQNFSTRVVCVALLSITTLLRSCDYVTPINSLVFSEYIIPKLHTLNSILSMAWFNEGECIKITLASCLPTLTFVAKKFWLISMNFKSIQNYSSSPGVNINTTADGMNNSDEKSSAANPMSISKHQLDLEIEKLSSALLTDLNAMVKISLINNISDLCEYFGIEKTNDFILPHLITYLNDSNYLLRLAFLDSILKLAPYVGIFSFEQYILPLLIRSLGDVEQLVVLKVLQVFNFVVENRIINPKSEFNALATYKELIVNSMPLVLHPSQWIRQSVITLLVSITQNLQDADKYCFLYPLIKGFLTHDLTIINWNALYTCLTKPLTKKIFDSVMSWSINATRSTFWSIDDVSYGASSDYPIKMKLLTDMGKSVYIHRSSNSAYSLRKGKSNIPLSSEDRKWVLKLKTIGFDEKELWKVFALRNYISHVAKLNSIGNKSSLNDQHMNTIPRNIFFEVYYRSEPLVLSSNTTETDYGDSEMNKDVTSSETYKASHNSLILPHLSRPKVSLQTVQANVFGEIDLNLEAVDLNHDDTQNHPAPHPIHGSNILQKTFVIGSQKLVTITMKHNYTGSNPFILNHLRNVDPKPTLENFPEFGPVLQPTRIFAEGKAWSPMGICVSHINTNKSSNQYNPVNCVAISPSAEFFITGSQSGALSLWDPARIIKNPTLKSPNLSMNLNSPVLQIKFIAKSLVFAVSTLNGSVILFRVDVTKIKGKKLNKFLKFSLIRRYELDQEDGFLTSMEVIEDEASPTVVGTTSSSKVVGISVIDMSTKFVFQNPSRFGALTSVIVDPANSWLLVSTNKGYLCLWDLRFSVMAKAWELKCSREDEVKLEIKLLHHLPRGYLTRSRKSGSIFFAMVHGISDTDFSVWEIPSFGCLEIFSSCDKSPRIHQYKLEEVSLKPLSGVEALLGETECNFGFDIQKDYSVTSLNFHEVGNTRYFISTTWDRRIVVWNLNRIDDSISLNTKGFHFYSSKIDESLTMNCEVCSDENGKSYLKHTSQMPLTNKKDTPKFNQDHITQTALLSYPFTILVAVDRSGCINLYK